MTVFVENILSVLFINGSTYRTVAERYKIGKYYNLK